MRINYTYNTNVTIIFDDEFEINMTDSLDNVVCKINWACDKYGFTKADVIESETGEILVTVAVD